MVDNDYEEIRIGALAVGQLLPEAMERIKAKALLHEDYDTICRQLRGGGRIDELYEIKDNLLCWKNRLYLPKRLRNRMKDSEHDSKVAGHFGRVRLMELLTGNFYWPNMGTDVRKYCNKCDNCQKMKVPRRAQHGLLHPLEMASKLWMHISTEFITDLPEGKGATMLLVVVDHFTKMAHVIPINNMDSPTVAQAYLQNVWKDHGFPEDVGSDRDRTFTYC